MKYTLIRRNRSLRTTSNHEFVSWMRKNYLQQWTNNQDFMKGYSKRKSTFEGLEIRFDNEQNFVNDLQKNNLLKIESSKGLFGLF